MFQLKKENETPAKKAGAAPAEAEQGNAREDGSRAVSRASGAATSKESVHVRAEATRQQRVGAEAARAATKSERERESEREMASTV